MANQKWVEIRHPNVNKTAVVAAVSVPHHRRSGWEPVESTGRPPAQDRQTRPQNRKPEMKPETEGTS